MNKSLIITIGFVFFFIALLRLLLPRITSDHQSVEDSCKSLGGSMEWVCSNYSYWIQRPVDCIPMDIDGKVVCGNIVIEDKKECVHWMLGCKRE